MRKFIPTIVVLLILAGLGGYVYYINQKPPAAPAPVANQIYNFESNIVAKIVLSKDAKVIQLEQQGLGNWQIVKPVTGPAGSIVGTSVDTYVKLTGTDKFDSNGNDLPTYGLDKPVIVTMTLTNGNAFTLLIGAHALGGNSAYVKKSDDKTIYTVSAQNVDPLLNWLDVPPVAPATATPLPLPTQLRGIPTVPGTATTP